MPIDCTPTVEVYPKEGASVLEAQIAQEKALVVSSVYRRTAQKSAVSDSSVPFDINRAINPLYADIPSNTTAPTSLLKKFDGYILSVGGDSFVARWKGDERTEPELEAEFELAELSPQDRALVAPGTPLVWNLSSRRTAGTFSRESIVYVRRIATPDENEINLSVEKTIERFGSIEWD
jgi:hypothetical protein